MIREKVKDLLNQKDFIDKEIKLIQEKCSHETSVYHPDGNSGGWDYDPSYWYDLFCYDCNKRWWTDQDIKPPKRALKVSKINYQEKPEVIELSIKIEEIKKNG